MRRSFALPLLFALGCGGGERPAPPALPPPPPPPPVVRVETSIGKGMGAEDSVDVFVEPNVRSRVMGRIRRGALFDVVEQRELEGTTWYRVQRAGWVRGQMIRFRSEGEPSIGRFRPFQPRLDDPMPYNMARVVARDGVPVYRTPPKRGQDPEPLIDRRLREGYFFTVDRWINIYDRQLHRGIRYWWIPREGTDMVTPPSFEGVEVTAQTRLPFVWVTDPTAKVCPEALEANASRAQCTAIERHTRLVFEGETRVQGGVWYDTDQGFIPSTQVSRLDRIRTLPPGLHAGEHWVHVDLRNQFAGLYEGDQLKFLTLISSGDDAHPTPTGTYRVQSKHISDTMDDEGNLSSPYFIQDVPWVMYFQGGYALHGAFWHDRFGLRTSHGCVNLSPRDARRFFAFVTSPELPPGLHAVFTPPDRQGTLVYVTR